VWSNVDNQVITVTSHIPGGVNTVSIGEVTLQTGATMPPVEKTPAFMRMKPNQVVAEVRDHPVFEETIQVRRRLWLTACWRRKPGQGVGSTPAAQSLWWRSREFGGVRTNRAWRWTMSSFSSHPSRFRILKARKNGCASPRACFCSLRGQQAAPLSSVTSQLLDDVDVG
jgi:hypothetical protein